MRAITSQDRSQKSVAPRIHGERIRLSLNERADITKFVAWLNDPEVHLRQAVYRDGLSENLLIMSVLRPEWNPGEQAEE